MNKKKGLKYLINRIKRFFSRKKTSSVEAEDRFSVSNRDVMIGTVRSGDQLIFNLEKKCYYTPAKFISKFNFPINYIALFEKFDDGFSGIRYVGKVVSFSKIRRRNIPVPMSRNNPREIYYLFEIEIWQERTDKISAIGRRNGPPAFTNQLLLENCRNSFELTSVSSEEQFKLLKVIHNISDAFDKDCFGCVKAERVNEYYSIALNSGDISIIKNNTEIFNEPMEEYRKHMKKSFQSYKTIIGTEDFLKRLR